SSKIRSTSRYHLASTTTTSRSRGSWRADGVRRRADATRAGCCSSTMCLISCKGPQNAPEGEYMSRELKRKCQPLLIGVIAMLLSLVGTRAASAVVLDDQNR